MLCAVFLAFRMHYPRYRMLIYSGNVDACVPTWGSEFWTNQLGAQFGVETEWHPWTSDSADPVRCSLFARHVPFTQGRYFCSANAGGCLWVWDALSLREKGDFCKKSKCVNVRQRKSLRWVHSSFFEHCGVAAMASDGTPPSALF